MIFDVCVGLIYMNTYHSVFLTITVFLDFMIVQILNQTPCLNTFKLWCKNLVSELTLVVCAFVCWIGNYILLHHAPIIEIRFKNYCICYI